MLSFNILQPTNNTTLGGALIILGVAKVNTCILSGNRVSWLAKPQVNEGV